MDGHPVSGTFSAGIEWFVPARIRGGEEDGLRRARLVVAFGWILMSLAILYAVVFFLLNSPIGAAALGVGAGVAVVGLWVMRRTGSCFAAGNLFTAAFFAVLTVLACRLGGHGAPALPWYAAVPVVALKTAGRRSAVFWLAVLVSSLTAFFALDYGGYSLPNDLTPRHYELLRLLSLSGLMMLMFGLALLYETAKDRMLRLRTRAEEELQQSEERFRRFAVASRFGFAMGELTGQLVFANTATLRIVEEETEEAFTRKTFYQYHLPEDAERLKQEILPIVLERGHWVGEVPLLSARGNLIAAEQSIFLIRDEQGTPRMFGNIITDITERKRAEEKLRGEKELSDDIINSLPGLFYIFDQERFVRWNKRWEAVTGYSAEELRTKNGPDFFEGADKAHIMDRMQAVFREGAADAEAEIVTKDGRKIPFYFTGLRSTFDGRAYLVGLGIDVTKRRQTEAELAKAKNEAEAATKVKSEFLANMSHEIRTPMTAILGFSELLMGNVTDQERLDAATTIRQNGEYLIAIINDILDLSKIEAGKLEVEHVPCSPCQVLSEVASLMRVRANAKNLLLEIEYQGQIPQSIRSDAIRLRQILINLIGNAIKFTEVGKVRLAARLADTASAEPKLQFEVVDSGIGMTEAQIAELFKPFSQVDASTTRGHGGTGLGLTISKRLAGRLGGDITVKSTPGAGSTFTVTVGTGPLDGVKLLDNPTEARSPTDANEKPATPRPKLDCRVLLAEDGPDNQRLIAFLLRKAGAEVTVADHGQIAYDLALAARDEGTPFDVILMDMQMPVMDGYDTTGRLREAGYTGPIIALTAHAMRTDQEKCLDAGCDGYATKPIDREKLISLVAEYALPQELPKAGDAPIV